MTSTEQTAAMPSLRSLFDLTGRAAVITGGHGDLAEAMADGLAELGCSVVLAARRVASCEELAHSLESRHGVRAIPLAVDVSQEDDVARLIDTAVGELGRLDILVNSAATFWAAPPEDVPIDRGWRRVIDVNLTGTFMACQAAGRHMLAAGSGSIVNVASTGGLMSFMPSVGSTLSYTTSKGAIISLTRDLAAQWSVRGVRVNAVAPGSMAGGMTHTIPDENQAAMVSQIPIGRQGRPDELRGAVAYLASDASSYVTGTVLVVDGGQTIV
jgi:gluconate 5-dehydrogenase